MTTSTCPQCGAAASGRFCSSCAAPLAGAECGACGASITPGAKFCHKCGATAGATAPAGGGARQQMWPWILATVLGGVMIAVIGYVIGQSSQNPAPPAQAAAPAQQGGFGQATTDLSTMTPREQADRLFDRVMRAHEQGDMQQVTFFAPMALQTYGLLEELDADARYHIGLIATIAGDLNAALAQVDTLRAEYPGHLMAAMIAGRVAQMQQDPDGQQRAYEAFMANVDAELAAQRPEYEAHQRVVDAYRAEAEAAGARN